MDWKKFIGFASLIILLMGCASNKTFIAQKDQEIAQLKKQLAEKESAATDQQKKSDQLTADLNKQLADLKQKEQVWIAEKEGMTAITLPNAVLFATGSVKLTPDGKKAIDEIWKVLSKYPDRKVQIQGHTDNIPIAKKFEGKYKSNWELSSARAHTVLHYVMTKPDAKPKRLAAVGYGEFQPIADNTTKLGRAKNRRVVIAVMGKSS